MLVRIVKRRPLSAIVALLVGCIAATLPPSCKPAGAGQGDRPVASGELVDQRSDKNERGAASEIVQVVVPRAVARLAQIALIQAYKERRIDARIVDQYSLSGTDENDQSAIDEVEGVSNPSNVGKTPWPWFMRSAYSVSEAGADSNRRDAAFRGVVAAVFQQLASGDAITSSIPTKGTPFDTSRTERYIASLEIKSGVYKGAWRYIDAGGVNWYFLFAAMVLGDYFTQNEIRTAVEVALDKGVVGRWEANSEYAPSTKVVIDGKIFFCNIGGTTGNKRPDVSGIKAKAAFVGDGTVTWEYLGLTIPKSWQWFLVDIDNDLFSIRHPDSNDAYAGMVIAAARKAGVDSAWLSAPSRFPAMRRMDLLAALARHNITDQITANLTGTFQNNIAGNGKVYDISFLADNVEAWRGMKALADLHTIAGEAADAVAAEVVGASIKTGVKSLWHAKDGRFATYRGETKLGKIRGNAAFVSDLRFHIWPWLHGIWTTASEIWSSVDPVLAYTVDSVPGLWTAHLDTFVMAEWYYAVAKLPGWKFAANVLQHRVNVRMPSAITISDAVLSEAARSRPTDAIMLVLLVNTPPGEKSSDLSNRTHPDQ